MCVTQFTVNKPLLGRCSNSSLNKQFFKFSDSHGTLLEYSSGDVSSEYRHFIRAFWASPLLE
jgi:hypothetical protein